MNRTRWLLAVLLGAILVTAGVGAVIAASPETFPFGRSEAEEDAGESDSEDSAEDRAEGEDVAIGDPVALERASAAALAYLADQGLNGEVTATEQGDEESYYEVEVTLDDGRQVDVQLTDDFEVVGLD